MKPRTWKSMIEIALLSAVVLAGTVSLAPARGVQAEMEVRGQTRARKLEGTWRVQVTIRNCQTGAEIRTFATLLTFAQGGTMTETTSASSPALRGPGHGVWQHTGGHNYSSVFEAFLFNAAGVWTGTQRLTQTIEIGGDPDEFNANASNEIFDTTGNLLVTGCSTAVGTRLE